MRLVRRRHANLTGTTAPVVYQLKVVLHGVSPLIWRLERRHGPPSLAVTRRLAEMLGEVFDTSRTNRSLPPGFFPLSSPRGRLRIREKSYAKD